jgi:hypothetical protein
MTVNKGLLWFSINERDPARQQKNMSIVIIHDGWSELSASISSKQSNLLDAIRRSLLSTCSARSGT